MEDHSGGRGGTELEHPVACSSSARREIADEGRDQTVKITVVRYLAPAVLAAKTTRRFAHALTDDLLSPRAMQLDVERWKALTSLWKDVHALHAKDLDAGWRMVCERLGSLFGSAGGFALFFVRTPGGAFHGWQPMRQLDHGDGSDARMKMSAEWAMTAECRSDPYAAKMFEESGFARAYRPSDLAPSETERLASPSYRLMEKYGVEDRMVAVCSVSEDVEVVFGFDRPAGADDFTEADRDTAEVAMEMLGKTCRWLALSYGYYPRGNPLTDRERSVLAHLLNGFSEKEAASRVGISPGSLHQVVVRAYRKFGVQSRAELMALWLATDD